MFMLRVLAASFLSGGSDEHLYSSCRTGGATAQRGGHLVNAEETQSPERSSPDSLLLSLNLRSGPRAGASAPDAHRRELPPVHSVSTGPCGELHCPAWKELGFLGPVSPAGCEPPVLGSCCIHGSGLSELKLEVGGSGMRGCWSTGSQAGVRHVRERPPMVCILKTQIT